MYSAHTPRDAGPIKRIATWWRRAAPPRSSAAGHLRIIRLVFAVLALGASCWQGALAADENDARRVTVGLNLFPAVLAAEQDIAAKRSAAGMLVLLLVHRDDPEPIDRLAAVLRDKGAIRGVPLNIRIVDVQSLRDHPAEGVAGVFVAQRLGEDLAVVLDYSRRHGVLSFSPFQGDVERGVVAGIAVSDRVLPYVNMTALAASGLQLKPFFLRIAERYEQP